MNKIYLLPKAELTNIPETLRLMADEIERGDYGTTISAAIVTRSSDGTIDVFSCGDTNNDRAVALFTRGIHFLVSD